VGKGIPSPDAEEKTKGKAEYGIDVRPRGGQFYAAIWHSPRIGGVLQNTTLPQGLPGVRGLVKGKDYVAVVASSYYQAAAALQKAKTQTVWDNSKALRVSTSDIFKAYRGALNRGVEHPHRSLMDSRGNTTPQREWAFKQTYSVPLLAHMAMEPLNATAMVSRGKVKVWAGHQSGSLAKLFAACAANVSCNHVEVDTPYLGGGFGRRADLNYITKAVEIARQFPHVPVQTIWSRAEDIRDDFFRPAAMADVFADLDPKSQLPSKLIYRVAAPAASRQYASRVATILGAGVPWDRSMVDGAIFHSIICRIAASRV